MRRISRSGQVYRIEILQKSWTDEEGILRINVIDFLLDENNLDR